jgi:hypothetical protein
MLFTANAVPTSLIISNLMMEAINSSENTVLATATLHHTAEDDIRHSYHR